MADEEILDVVDEHDHIIATLPRSEVYRQNLKYLRFVDAFIINDKGQFWVPTRVTTKEVSPGGFDIGVGGHVSQGETYQEAFRKEVSEEIGWDIDELEWREVGKFGPSEGLDTFSMVYEIKSNKAPKINNQDFSSAQWLLPDEIVSKINAGHPAKSNLTKLLHIVYGTKV